MKKTLELQDKGRQIEVMSGGDFSSHFFITMYQCLPLRFPYWLGKPRPHSSRAIWRWCSPSND